MAITINGVSIQQPTDHGWDIPSSMGTGANGNEVISSFWSYSMKWDSLDADEFNKIWAIWLAHKNDDITADLPELGAAAYGNKTYTCRINTPSYRGFMEENYISVQLVLTGIDITL